MTAIDKKIAKMMLKVLKPLTKSLQKIMKFFKMIFMYIKCFIKLIMNIPKCFIFYFIDIIKYTLLYLPLLILMGMLGLAKEWIPIQKTLDKFIGWPNDTLNTCYRCKNKKGLSFFDKIKNMMKKQNMQGDRDSVFNFFTFLIVCLIGGILMYFFWFKFLKKKI